MAQHYPPLQGELADASHKRGHGKPFTCQAAGFLLKNSRLKSLRSPPPAVYTLLQTIAPGGVAVTKRKDKRNRRQSRSDQPRSLLELPDDTVSVSQPQLSTNGGGGPHFEKSAKTNGQHVVASKARRQKSSSLTDRDKRCNDFFRSKQSFDGRRWSRTVARWHDKPWLQVLAMVKVSCVLALAGTPGTLQYMKLQAESSAADKTAAVIIAASAIMMTLYVTVYDKFMNPSSRTKSVRTENLRLSHQIVKLGDIVSFRDDLAASQSVGIVVEHLLVSIRQAAKAKLNAADGELKVNLFEFVENGSKMKATGRSDPTNSTDEVPFPVRYAMPYHAARALDDVQVGNCDGKMHPFERPQHCSAKSKYLMPLLKMDGDHFYCFGIVTIESNRYHRFTLIDKHDFADAVAGYRAWLLVMLTPRAGRIEVK